MLFAIIPGEMTEVSKSEEELTRDVSSLSLTSSNASGEETFADKSHPVSTLRNIYSYLQDEKLCDVVLIAEDLSIPVHKVVLAASSEYFQVMFTGALREASQKEIKLENVDGESLQAVIKYCYTGQIEIKEATVESLLATSSLLQLPSVKEACCDYLKRQLDPCNCLGIASFAEQQSCDSLYIQALTFAYNNYVKVIRNQEFLSLTADQLAMLFLSNELNVPKEENVFESLVLWVDHNREVREKDLPKLLNLVKLPLLSTDFLLDRVLTYCGENVECQKLIMESVRWHLQPARRSELTSHRTKPRIPAIGKLIAVGGGGVTLAAHGGYHVVMDIYDPCNDSWKSSERVAMRIFQYGTALAGNRLIIAGGRTGLKTLSTVDAADLTTRTMSALSPLHTARHGLALTALPAPSHPHYALYAIGGHDGWTYLNSVERWDPANRSWSEISPLANARSTCAAVTLNGRIYAIGGRDSSNCLRSVEVYDPATDRWSACSSLVRRRGGVSATAANGFIFALGGHDRPSHYLQCIERYDPMADEWQIIAKLSSARDAIGCCAFGDRIAAVGGYDGQQFVTTAEVIDPTTGENRRLAPLAAPLVSAALVVLPH